MPRNTLIQLRRDTATQWTAVNPILAAGELACELDTGRLKVGDGETAWSSLSYVAGSVADAWPVGSIFVSVSATNPATTLGFGTWSSFGSGRVLVGLDSGDTDFDTAEETGGSKTV